MRMITSALTLLLAIAAGACSENSTPVPTAPSTMEELGGPAAGYTPPAVNGAAVATGGRATNFSPPGLGDSTSETDNTRRNNRPWANDICRVLDETDNGVNVTAICEIPPSTRWNGFNARRHLRPDPPPVSSPIESMFVWRGSTTKLRVFPGMWYPPADSTGTPARYNLKNAVFSISYLNPAQDYRRRRAGAAPPRGIHRRSRRVQRRVPAGTRRQADADPAGTVRSAFRLG